MQTHSDDVRSRAAIAGHPIHPMIVPFPIAFLSGALITDVVQWQSGDLFWARASFWLLAAGVATALLAALFGATDFLLVKAARRHSAGWFHALGNIAAVALSILNLLLRWKDPIEPIVPMAIGLSLIVTLLLMVTGWFGGELSYRHRIGVIENPHPPRG